jgi:hypothetical protein
MTAANTQRLQEARGTVPSSIGRILLLAAVFAALVAVVGGARALRAELGRHRMGTLCLYLKCLVDVDVGLL